MKNSLAIFLLAVFASSAIYAQQQVNGIVADVITHEPLPFATIKQGKTNQGIITDINGHFSLNTGATDLEVSYLGYQQVTVPSNNIDTIFLQPVSNQIGEVVIQPPYDKIRRIINNAIRNKDIHNPDKYDWYRCNIYYKMAIDLLPTAAYFKEDTTRQKYEAFATNNHVLFSETYNKRIYKKPGKLQEIILASKMSGIKKTHFTNLVTGVIPFHIYDDQISLIGNNYLHPVAKGWQSRYEFDLLDEILDGADTVFILRYYPKKSVTFKSLQGKVYINSNGYAISHFTGLIDDTIAGRKVELEQIYKNIDNKWFPQELNYEFSFKKYPNPNMGIKAIGHSVTDEIEFTEDKSFHFDKAQTVKNDEQIDSRTEDEWNSYRPEKLSAKEQNTYRVIDSIAKEAGITGGLNGLSHLHEGRIPVSFLDVDMKRIIAANAYESLRLGIGLFTNDRVSKYFSAGGWMGYGFKDKVWKYGASLAVYPKGNKNNWLEIAYQKNYRSTGFTSIHPELDKSGSFRYLLLQQADLVEDYVFTYHKRYGFLETELTAKLQHLDPQYNYTFDTYASNPEFDVREAGINLRYGYGEKRTPLFGFYVPAGTKFPLVYVSLNGGEVNSDNYSCQYARTTAALSYQVHINRWGKDHYLLTGGKIWSLNNQPIPKPLLLAANGYRLSDDLQLYMPGGFVTMLPYQYFNDAFLSLYYKHDFDKRLYNLRYSQPFLSLAYNVMYGSLQPLNSNANPGVEQTKDYHEGGFILNDLVRFNYLNVAYIGLNAGAFYNINSVAFNPGKYGCLTIGASLRF